MERVEIYVVFEIEYWLELDYSLEVLEEVGEGAVGSGFLLLEGEDTAVFGGVGFPLGPQFEVVVHALVTDVQVFVAPVRRSQLRARYDLGDPGLLATQFGGLVHGVDVVEDGAFGDGCKVVAEVGVAV